MRPLLAERRIDSAIHRAEISIPRTLTQHHVGVVIGALLGAGSVAAAMALVTGPVGIMAGLVAGILGGGLAAEAVAGTIGLAPTQAMKEQHPGRPPAPRNESRGRGTSENPGQYTMPKAFREQWHHLDESNKDLIKGSELEETDE